MTGYKPGGVTISPSGMHIQKRQLALGLFH